MPSNPLEKIVELQSRRLGILRSIHVPRVGSDQKGRHGWRYVHVSIHAPRVGSDGSRGNPVMQHGVSIYVPRVGSDAVLSSSCRTQAATVQFKSAHSAEIVPSDLPRKVRTLV